MTIVDSAAVEELPQDDVPCEPMAVAVRQAPQLTVAPQVLAGDLVARLDTIREAMETAMVEGVDYGRIPGVTKPTLLKPGAEKLGVLFQLDVQIDNQKTWGPGEHLTVNSKAVVFHSPTGTRIGYGEGLCTTRERKYGKRKQERLCPTCNAPAVIKGKAEFGGGWLCWKKKDGCGAKFGDGDQAIESQETGEIENPDLPDLWNTVLKMSEKRARVDAILAVTAASALFTQDVEDRPAPTEDAHQAQPRASAAPPRSAPQEKTIDPERATAIGLLIHEATQAGVLDETGLSLTFTAAGVHVERINGAAVAALTASQADSIERDLNALLPNTGGQS